MGAFGGLQITNKGRALQAKAQAGAQLRFNRIAIGDGTLGSQLISDLNALISEKKTLSITKLKAQTGGRAVVGGVLSNKDMSVGFYFREIGVFAQDPDVGEILYCYGNAGQNAEYVPAGGGPDIVEKHIDIVTIVGTAANVSANIDTSLVFATAQDMADLEQRVTEIVGTEKENYDADLQNYTIVKKLRKDGTLKEKSELINKNATTKRFEGRVITKYAANGTTVLETRTLSITYDANGEFLKEV